ncbi:MAG: hypothetical protein LQ346_006181 [Caloplaca aetnensis]|nr:MAG: hypothetical protein LQ346_006181 [Caloplaca aetnensis]
MTMAVRAAALQRSPSPPPTDSESNKSFETPPTSISGDSPKFQRNDAHRKALLKVDISTPAVFKDVLLRTLPWDGLSAYPLNRHHLNDDVPVMVHNGRTYYLRPGYAVLMHDTPSGHKGASTWFTQLFYNQRLRLNEEERPLPFCYANGATSGDFFLPLGSLIEEAADSKGEKRATNYCWALNISTDPASLWLVFDYVMVSPSGHDTTIELSQIYLNEYNELTNYAYAFEEAPQAHGYLGLGSAWDVAKVFDDIDKDWQPAGAKAAKLDGPERRWKLGSTMRAYPLEKPPMNASRLRYFQAHGSY